MVSLPANPPPSGPPSPPPRPPFAPVRPSSSASGSVSGQSQVLRVASQEQRRAHQAVGWAEDGTDQPEGLQSDRRRRFQAFQNVSRPSILKYLSNPRLDFDIPVRSFDSAPLFKLTRCLFVDVVLCWDCLNLMRHWSVWNWNFTGVCPLQPLLWTVFNSGLFNL